MRMPQRVITVHGCVTKAEVSLRKTWQHYTEAVLPSSFSAKLSSAVSEECCLLSSGGGKRSNLGTATGIASSLRLSKPSSCSSRTFGSIATSLQHSESDWKRFNDVFNLFAHSITKEKYKTTEKQVVQFLISQCL